MSSPITRSAKGEECTCNMVDSFTGKRICNYNPETTVFAHHPDGTGGSNKLAGEVGIGGYACGDCHDQIDSRAQKRVCQADLEFYMRRSVKRTTDRLIEKGFLRVC